MSDYEPKNQLLPRRDKYKDLISNQQVPKTTETKLIIPCLTKTFGFRTNEYRKNQKILQGVIDKESFDIFIHKINSIIEQIMIIKAKKENGPFFSHVSYLLKLSILISLLGFLLLSSIVYWTLQGEVFNSILTISFVLLGVSSLIAVVCPIYLLLAKYEIYDFEESIKSKLDQLVAEQNKNNSRDNKGYIKWNVQKNFFWVELHIDRTSLSSKPKSLYQQK